MNNVKRVEEKPFMRQGNIKKTRYQSFHREIKNHNSNQNDTELDILNCKMYFKYVLHIDVSGIY